MPARMKRDGGEKRETEPLEISARAKARRQQLK
jgi:hypothetical protein